MDLSPLLDVLTSWLAWAVGEGRPRVFVVLMSLFLASFVVLGARERAPATPAGPLLHPPRRPPGPDAPAWRRDREIASALLEQGRTLEALQAYRRLLADDPKDADALFNLGHAYFRLRLYPQALACWRGVRRLQPQAVDARANLRFVKRLMGVGEARKAGPPRMLASG